MAQWSFGGGQTIHAELGPTSYYLRVPEELKNNQQRSQTENMSSIEILIQIHAIT